MADEPTDLQAQVEMRELELAADEAILACGGDLRETIKALILANGFLESEMCKVSYGYARRALGQKRSLLAGTARQAASATVKRDGAAR